MDRDKGFFDRPLVKKITGVTFGAALALLVCGHLLLPRYHYFSFGKLPVFYGLAGFAAGAGLLVLAALLRPLLSREEDYYD